MKTKNALNDTRPREDRRFFLVLLLVAAFAVVTRGTPPADPLPAPLFSFDLDSPSVMDCEDCSVEADALLTPGSPYAMTVIPGSDIGLGQATDDLDAVSVGNASVPIDATFALLFSVHESSLGTATPDSDMVVLGVPYNARDQALRGQAAGDQFMSTTLFSRSGQRGSQRAAGSNNVLVRNNFDEGGTDFSAAPPTSAGMCVFGEDQDRVDATVAVEEADQLYFSASALSPSLGDLSGTDAPSGADIFYVSLGQVQPDVQVFAFSHELGLVPQDDIDALLVFDVNSDGTFNDDDMALFSLTPTSPSLDVIAEASTDGAAADIFTARPGQLPTLFASAASLGLGAVEDNIDALDYLLCNDATACALAHGIRGGLGDFDDDGDVDSADFVVFEQCFSGPGRQCDPGCERGDFDGDGDIDCADWDQFTQAWTAAGGPPELPECRDGIPTLSEWGTLLMGLLLVGSGMVVFSRSRTRISHPATS